LILQKRKDRSRVIRKADLGGKIKSSVWKLSNKQWERIQQLARDVKVFFRVIAE
jgi:hypothetical protein